MGVHGLTAAHGSASCPIVWFASPRSRCRSQAGAQEALGDELAHHREVRRAELVGVALEQVGEGVEDLPDGQLAVAGTDQRGLDRVDLPGAAAARSAGAARSSRGPRRPGRRRVSCCTSARATSRSSRPTSSRTARPQSRIAGRDRLLDGVRPVEELAGRAAAAEVDPAEADRPRCPRSRTSPATRRTPRGSRARRAARRRAARARRTTRGRAPRAGRRARRSRGRARRPAARPTGGRR